MSRIPAHTKPRVLRQFPLSRIGRPFLRHWHACEDMGLDCGTPNSTWESEDEDLGSHFCMWDMRQCLRPRPRRHVTSHVLAVGRPFGFLHVCFLFRPYLGTQYLGSSLLPPSHAAYIPGWSFTCFTEPRANNLPGLDEMRAGSLEALLAGRQSCPWCNEASIHISPASPSLPAKGGPSRCEWRMAEGDRPS